MTRKESSESCGEAADQVQLSFAGCGFLCIYHAGVCAAIKEYAPQFTQHKIRGSSAGAIAAAGLICNVCMSHATSTILQVVTEARSGSLQALSPNFNLLSLVRKGLDHALPPDAHITCTGRLFISATRARDYKNVLISEFATRDELIQAILCSCFIPFYCGLTPPSYRGEQYIDGGFSDNQPGKLEPGTVTVSPFSGESDICPSDEDSASLFGFDFYGTSIQFTTQNLFRMVVTLFPPSPEVCSRICRQGFEDALRFLTKNYMAPCVKCLTVQSNAIPVSSSAPQMAEAAHQQKTQQESMNERIRELVRRRRAATVSVASNLRNECGRCMEPLDRYEPPRFSCVPLPTVVQQSLAEMERAQSTWLNYLRRWRLFRWWYRLLIPVILPFEVLQLSLRTIREWVRSAAATETYATRFQQLVDFVLQEVENRRLLHSPALFPASALPVGPISSFKLASSDAAAAPPQKQEGAAAPAALRKFSVMTQQQQRKPERKVSAAVAPLDLAVSSGRIEEWEGAATAGMAEAEDSMNVLLDYCNRHDAILAFHYMDDTTQQLKMCQIFDAGGRHPRGHHHSGALVSSTYLAEETPDDAEKAYGEDSGLSLAEEEINGTEERRKVSSALDASACRKDACCSPVRHLAGGAEKPLGVRRHTFSFRGGAGSQPAPNNENKRRPSSMYASNSMSALREAAAANTRTGTFRRKTSMRMAPIRAPPVERGCSSDSEEASDAKQKASAGRQQRQKWNGR